MVNNEAGRASARDERRADEARRSEILARYPLHDRELSAELDRLARLAARTCQTDVGLVSIVTADRQDFLGRSGTVLSGTPREWSFCQYAMLREDCLVVPDATRDPRFSANPLVTGEPHIRFYAGYPLHSSEGVPLGSFCVIAPEPRECLTEEQHDSLGTLAMAAAGLLERYRVEYTRADDQQSTLSVIGELERRFDFLADAMPQLVWMTDRTGAVVHVNRGWLDFTGQPAAQSLGAAWLQFVHPEDRARAELVWQDAVDGPRPYEIEYRLRRHDDVHRWFLTRGLPMIGEDGEVMRWVGTCTEIHEQRESAERLEILSRELNHRIKNIFAVIAGLISLTLRGNDEIREQAARLQARVLALGRAHDFVRTHRGFDAASGIHSDLREMLAALLEPYSDAASDRVTIEGDDVAIDDRSATPLALFFHELATNAAKYGALSRAEGRVRIALECDEEAVRLVWTELAGPPVFFPARTGFGTKLIDMSICRQLGGTIDYDWDREGLIVSARVPLSAMSRAPGG